MTRSRKSSEVRNIEAWMTATAVRVGALWVPPNQVEDTLGRFTKQLFCLTHREKYPYAFLGSATAVRFGERFFLVWCKHQTRGYEPDEVTIPIDGGRTLISGSEFISVRIDGSNEDEDYTDLCA